MVRQGKAAKVEELGWWDLCAPMRPEEFEAIRDALGWTDGEVARRLRLVPSAITKWKRGGPITGPACVALRLYLERHVRHELLG